MSPAMDHALLIPGYREPGSGETWYIEDDASNTIIDDASNTLVHDEAP